MEVNIAEENKGDEQDKTYLAAADEEDTKNTIQRYIYKYVYKYIFILIT